MGNFVEQYKAGYDQLVSAIQGLTEQEMDFKTSPASWSIKEIVIHVTDAEMVHLHRMKAVLSEDNPLLTAFDQDAWSSNLKYQTLDYNLYLSLFKALRDSFLLILERVSDADFARIGTHNSEGEITLRQIVMHSIDHVTGHIEQIQRVIAAFPQ